MFHRKAGRNTEKLKKQEHSLEKMKYKPTCPTKANSQIKEKSMTKRPDRETPKINNDDEEKDECDNSCEIVVCPLKCEQDG